MREFFDSPMDTTEAVADMDSSFSDVDLVIFVEQLELDRELYCPMVKDISFDDNKLLTGINHIEQS